MKIPKRLQILIEDGLIQSVSRQLMSGKEAQVFVVQTSEGTRCAKVYKEATQRSFRQAAEYTDNRKTKNSRQTRAMAKKTAYGRKTQEEAWQNAEVDALYRLANAGVRVPTPYHFYEGVLLMELVSDEAGNAAPRLLDIEFSEESALRYHQQLIRQIVYMLCAGVVHGDLSEYNVLLDEQGPVIIDLPQAVDAAGNNHAPMIFARDVGNVTNYFSQYALQLKNTQYAQEIWALYQQGALRPDSELTGRYEQREENVDLNAVLLEIETALQEERERRERMADI